jgi:hypothetical protein
MQAGQRSGISRFVSNESSTIVSVLSPVETAVPRIGQRIMILGVIGDAKTERPQS